jgi:type IX secretion system PorP/SprF family membrane protein
LRKWLIIGIWWFAGGCLWAQDAHWSQFNWSPLYLNPALTGNFDGRWRFVGNYRDQWRAVSRPYQTFAVSADARDFVNVRNLGLGMLFFHDIVGTSRYRTISAGLPVSYRIGLTRDSIHSIHLGVMPAFERQSIDPSALTFDDQYNGWRYDPNRQSAEVFAREVKSHFNINAGITYTFQRKKGWSFTAGYSLQNATKPKISYLNGASAIIGTRQNLHASAYLPLSMRWFLTPSAVYSTQITHREIVAGSEINLLFDGSRYRYRAIFVGAFTRFDDALIGSVGCYYNSWRAGVSYDVNYSPFIAATRYRGGFEVSVIYILRDILPGRENFKYCPVFL